MNPETKLQRAIMLALSKAGYTIWNVSEESYEYMVRVMFLLSDNEMAKKFPEFAKEMNVDIKANESEIKDLVYKWECLP